MHQHWCTQGLRDACRCLSYSSQARCNAWLQPDTYVSFVPLILYNMTALSPAFVASSVRFERWYDSKDADTQELIDEISDRTYFIIDEAEYDAFINLLKSEVGITTAEQFEDAFSGEFEGVGDHITTKFTEDWCDDVYPTDDLPDIYRSAIDFELVWYQSLRYDFYDFEFKGNTYFFNRHV